MVTSATDGGRFVATDPPHYGVRVALVLPPGVEADVGLQNRLTLVLKDIQWWYACQMMAHGYGAKTFTLESGSGGKGRGPSGRPGRPGTNGACQREGRVRQGGGNRTGHS